MNKSLLALGIMSLAFSPVGARVDSFINTGNPLIKHIHTADPAPMVEGDTLWLYAGHDEGGPDVKGYRMWEWSLFSTTDMKHWTQHPSPCRINDFFPWAKRGKAYAAHCIKSRKDGRYYFYVSTNGPGIGVAVSDSPKGPFKDALGKPLLTTADCKGTTHGWACIDPAVFYDKKGQPWITWGNQKCYIAKLKPNMIEIDGKIKEITPEGSNFTEAPWIHYANGQYYLTFANNWPETLGYAVSKNPDGPYKYMGVFSDTVEGSETTHPGFVEFNGQNLFFTHNGWMPGGSGSNRNVCVQPFEYNADGTLPQLNVTDTLYWDVTPSEKKIPYDAYLFAYFEGYGPSNLREQLRFAVSENGTDWKALNGNLPVVSSDSVSLSGGIRDPHILRGENGDFLIAMTDMMTFKNGWDRNTGIVLMRSDNLVDWQHSAIDLERDFPEKFGNVQWVWAPQTIWDPEAGAYLVYFTVKFQGTDTDPENPEKSVLDLYAAHVNQDFTEFVEEPYLMHQLKYGAIDEDIVYNPDDGLYHMFFKGNTKDKNGKEYINGIKQAVAPSLKGPWREDYRYVDAYAGKASVEGSGIFRLNPKDEERLGHKWCLMYDMYRDHRYEYQLSNDLFHFTEPKEFTKDFSPRHGTVMGITADEMKRMQLHYSEK